MSLEYAKSAQDALETFYQQPEALVSLKDLYNSILNKMQTESSELPATKHKEMVHNILDMSIQKIVQNLCWNLLKDSKVSLQSSGLPALIDLCIDGAMDGVLVRFAPYKVIEEIMECQTIKVCEKLWDVIEARKERLTGVPFFDTSGRTTKSSLTLLRICNTLLRRLSKTQDTVLCGRILVFLSSTFALTERSAVNLHSKANVGNLTAFEDQSTFQNAEAMERAHEQTNEATGKNQSIIDYKLYETFWNVQRYFREYALASRSLDDGKRFLEELHLVLTAFESNPYPAESVAKMEDTAVNIDALKLSDVASEHFFQPKYLTNSRLFRFQLKDPNLRRCILTQALILLDHLSRAKAASTEDSSMSKGYILTTYDRVMRLLENTPPDGEGFREMITSVLERERNWTKWKEERCPPYERSHSATDIPFRTPTTASPTNKLIGKPRKVVADEGSLIHQILTSSNQSSELLESLKDEARATEKPLVTLMQSFTEAWDPENGIDKEYWPDRSEVHCWRTLRQAMRSQIMHLDLALDGAGSVVKAVLGVDATSDQPAKDDDANKDASLSDDTSVSKTPDTKDEPQKSDLLKKPRKRAKTDSVPNSSVKGDLEEGEEEG